MISDSLSITARWALTLMIVGALLAAGCDSTDLRSPNVSHAQPSEQHSDQHQVARDVELAQVQLSQFPAPSSQAASDRSPHDAEPTEERLVIRGQSPMERARALLPNSERESKRLHGQLSLARLSERRGQTEQARHLYAQYLRKQPKNPVPYHRLGIIEAKAKRYSEAEEYLRKAAALGTPSATLLSDLGYLCYLQNRLEEAEEFLRRALRRDSENIAANNNLGLVLGEQHRFAESLSAFKNAVSPGEAHSNLAFVLTQMGEHRQALEQYSTALSFSKGTNLRAAAEAMVQLAEKRPELASGESSEDLDPTATVGERRVTGKRSAVSTQSVSEPSDVALADYDQPLFDGAPQGNVSHQTVAHHAQARTEHSAEGPARVKQASARRTPRSSAGPSRASSVVAPADFRAARSNGLTPATPASARLPGKSTGKSSVDMGQVTSADAKTQPKRLSPKGRTARRNAAPAVNHDHPTRQSRVAPTQVIFASPQREVAKQITHITARSSSSIRPDATQTILSNPPRVPPPTSALPVAATRNNQPRVSTRQRPAQQQGWHFVDQRGRPAPTSLSAPPRVAGASLRIADHENKPGAD